MKNNKTNNTQNVELLYSSDPDMRFDLGGQKAFATFFTDRVRSVYREGEIFDPSGIRIQVDEEDGSILIYATLENVDLKRPLTTADTQVVVSFGMAQIIVPILVIPADCRRSVPAQKNVTLNSRTVATWYPAIGLTGLTFAGLKFDKSLLGFGITHTYCPLSLNCGWGYGWKSNMDVKLAKAATLGVSNAAAEDCVYEAENGFRYLFTKRYYYINSVGNKTVVNASDVVIVNEKPTYDGVELQKEYYCELGLIAKDSDKSAYALVLENGNVDYYFDSNGNLAYIQDKYGNYIEFTWEKVTLPSNASVWAIKNAKESVPKGNGEYDTVTVTFTRDTDENITNVAYDSSSSNSKTFTYRYDGGFLTHIQFSDNFKVYMSYKNGLLGALTWHADGVRTEFSYTGNKLTQLKLMSRLGEISKDSTLQTDYKTVSVLNFGLLTDTSMPYMSKDDQKQVVFVDCDDCDAGGYTQLMEKQVLSAPLTFNYTDIDGRWGFAAFEEENARPLFVSANVVEATKQQGSAEAAVLLATVSGSQIPKGRKELVVSAQAKLRGQVNSSDVRRFTLPYKTVGTDEDFVYGIKAVVNFADNTTQTYYSSFNSTVSRLQPVALPLSFTKQVSTVNVYGVSKLPNATATFRNVRIAAGNWTYLVYRSTGELYNVITVNKLVGFDSQGVPCYRDEESHTDRFTDGKPQHKVTTVSMWKNGVSFWEKTYDKYYTYTDKGSQDQIRSFVSQDSATLGETITKFEYDTNGSLVRKYSYNTKNPNKRFYANNLEYDKYGRLAKKNNEFGEFLAEYIYDDDEDENKIESTPFKIEVAGNGCDKYTYHTENKVTKLEKFSHKKSDTVLDTIQFGYNFDKTTNVVNGLDNVFYTYDEEGEVRKVELNGEITEYVTEKNVVRNGKDCQSLTRVLPTGDRETVYSAKDGTYTEAVLNGVTISKQTYDEAGNLVRFEDKRTGKNTDYEYDELDRVKIISSVVTNEDDEIVDEKREGYGYNEYGEVKSKTIYLNGKIDQYTYGYKNRASRELDYTQVNGWISQNYVDIYGRYLCKNIMPAIGDVTPVAETYTYKQKAADSFDYSSSLPESIELENGSDIVTLGYQYAVNGNISKITENGSEICSYRYDEFGKLYTEINSKLNSKSLYSYDKRGNILKKVIQSKDGKNSQTYTYGYSGNKLISYNGEACEYNGNKLTKWRNKAVEWQGRNLTKLGTNTFAYDGFGNRRRKNSIYFTYDSQGNLIEQSNGLHFMYDHTGVMGFTYQGQTYFYQKDLQGNIVTIVNAAGAPVAQYYYDAWGNHKVYDGDYITEMTSPTFIGNLNPFRYRGYYYDTETKLYYLKSRYYDPEVGRFISADTIDYAEPSQFNGLNIYAYCNNNPVMFVDPDGNMPNWLKWVIGGVVIVGLVIASVATGGAAAGVAGFIVAGALKGAIIGAVSGALISGTIGGITSALSEEGNFWSGFADGAADGFMSGAIVGGITGAISSSVQVANAAKSWATTGGKSGFKQMTEHYTKHVINEGQKSVAKNIVNYTKQAKMFFANNNASGYLLREGVIKIAGAPGGIFNTNGLIRSFWYVLL